MKKHQRIYTPLLVLVAMLSCNGQHKTDSTKADTPQLKQAEIILPETDPYFTKSEAITTTKGPTSITRTILQDKKGTLWFATWEGIIHYDGTTFTNVTTKENLKRFRVFTILEDKDGTIWFGTIGAGLYRYDGKAFTNFTTKEGLINDSIGCIMEDTNGTLWIGTMGGISKYDGTAFTNFNIEGGRNNNDINAIVEDDNGTLWIGTRGDACLYDGNTFTTVTNPEGRPFKNVRTILKTKEGNIWLGGNDGLWSHDGSGYTNLTKNFVGYLYQDTKENIWTSSATEGNSGYWTLSKYDKMSQLNKGATAVHVMGEKGMFFGIAEDKEGGIWLGTLNGVYRYDGLTFNNFR